MWRRWRSEPGGLKPAGYVRWASAFAGGGLLPSARLALICALVALADAPVHACPICFQVEDANAVNGVRAAVAVLIGVTVAVLVGFAGFAVRLTRNQSSTEPRNPAPRTQKPDARTLNPGTEALRNPQ